jgi:protocatechuate 3,4-dioxygenase alpha subunit
MSLPATPGQTVGPFFGIALPYDGGDLLVPAEHPDAVLLHGRVLDGAGDPVPDALVELWQADAAGTVVQRPGSLHRAGDFTGWGREETDADGRYSFTTLTPGAPFFALTVFARGLLDRLFTRAYLPSAADDPFLATLAPHRRETLLARADEHGFSFDIRLQGDGETVFLRYPRD